MQPIVVVWQSFSHLIFLEGFPVHLCLNLPWVLSLSSLHPFTPQSSLFLFFISQKLGCSFCFFPSLHDFHCFGELKMSLLSWIRFIRSSLEFLKFVNWFRYLSVKQNSLPKLFSSHQEKFLFAWVVVARVGNWNL